MGKRVTLKIEGPPVFDDNGVPKGKGRPRASARIVLLPATGSPSGITPLMGRARPAACTTRAFSISSVNLRT